MILMYKPPSLAVAFFSKGVRKGKEPPSLAVAFHSRGGRRDKRKQALSIEG